MDPPPLLSGRRRAVCPPVVLPGRGEKRLCLPPGWGRYGGAGHPKPDARGKRGPVPLYAVCLGEFCAGNREEERKIAEFGQYNEIGCHNFVHDAMDSLEENLDSLGRFERWMEEIGVPFQRVFASPRGMYGVNMAARSWRKDIATPPTSA